MTNSLNLQNNNYNKSNIDNITTTSPTKIKRTSQEYEYENF